MEFSNYLPLPLRGDHTIFYYLLLVVLAAQILHSLSVGILFFGKSSGDKRSNYCYGALLISFGLTLLHYWLVLAGVYERYPSLYFIPIYYTLAIPVLLFYHVKLSLYPQYQLRRSDLKHMILPIGQFVFFVFMFFSSMDFKAHYGRQFFNPFYGALEQGLFLTSFFAYLYFARRYVVQKRKNLRNKIELRRVFYARKLLQVAFYVFCIHTFFVLSDFLSYQFWDINLRSIRVFAALGILSFAGILFWLGVYGFQILLWGRKVLNEG